MPPALRFRLLRSILLNSQPRTAGDLPVIRRALCDACARRILPATSKEQRRHSRALIAPSRRKWGRSNHALGLATVSDAPAQGGPLAEYDRRVQSGRLRDDEHQRGIVQDLQDLHHMLSEYTPPAVVRPSISDLKPSRSFLGSIFGKTKSKRQKTEIPSNTPKGLYMFGDVGSGKTMLMDLFYDTLPPSITHKTRIHFHKFMQDVHKRMHAIKAQHGDDTDAILFVAADIAAKSSVLCFDEFQCTDVADAMILRRLIESLMSHGIVIVTTSNRHPDDLYKNGIQRESFIPCITILKGRLRVINLDSTTDYRKVSRPTSGVYHHPLDRAATSHAEKWFRFLGSAHDPPHRAVQHVWGREIVVPKASGRAAMFNFDELIKRATGAADYIELVREYDAFIVTNVPAMTYRERDWARRFITFIDAVYEGHAKLVLTTAVPLYELFMSPEDIQEALEKAHSKDAEHVEHKKSLPDPEHPEHAPDDAARLMMDDLGLNMAMMKNSSLFSGDEERFAFSRALSRLSEMGSVEWVERGLGMESRGGENEKQGWDRVKSKWREDSM